MLNSFGPCVHFQSMRYESFHRIVKSIFQATSCHKNPSITIAKKLIFKMCQVADTMKHEDFIIFNSEDCSNKPNNFYKSVKINDTTYRIEAFVVVNLSDDYVEFGEVVKIKKVL